jgi:Nif-specific regulatory protein
MVLATDGIIHGYHLPPSLQMAAGGEDEKDSAGSGADFQTLVRAYETTLIVEALKKSRGNQTKAARLLGTSKRVIQYKISNYGIDYKKYSGVKVQGER